MTPTLDYANTMLDIYLNGDGSLSPMGEVYKG